MFITYVLYVRQNKAIKYYNTICMCLRIYFLVLLLVIKS